MDAGEIVVAAGASTIQYLLPPLVREFREHHPQVRLQLANVTGKDGLALLRSDQADLAVGSMLDVPHDLSYEPVYWFDPMLILPLNHPLAEKKDITLKDLSPYGLILPPQRLTTYRMVDLVFQQAQVPYSVAIEVGGWEVIKQYVAMGLGISIVTGICINETDHERLAVHNMRRFFPQRSYGVVMRKGKYLARRRGLSSIWSSRTCSSGATITNQDIPRARSRLRDWPPASELMEIVLGRGLVAVGRFVQHEFLRVGAVAFDVGDRAAFVDRQVRTHLLVAFADQAIAVGVGQDAVECSCALNSSTRSASFIADDGTGFGHQRHHRREIVVDVAALGRIHEFVALVRRHLGMDRVDHRLQFFRRVGLVDRLLHDLVGPSARCGERDQHCCHQLKFHCQYPFRRS